MSMAVVRFYVGEDEEKAIVRLQSKLMANYDRIPWAASPPLIKPRYIDDVPILALTFWSDDQSVDHYLLRRVAAEMETDGQAGTGCLHHHAHRRQPASGAGALRSGAPGRRRHRSESGRRHDARRPTRRPMPAPILPRKGQVTVHVGGFLKTREDVERVVLGNSKGRPVYVEDVAEVLDGPAEPDQYVFFGTGPAAAEKQIGSQGAFPGRHAHRWPSAKAPMPLTWPSGCCTALRDCAAANCPTTSR